MLGPISRYKKLFNNRSDKQTQVKILLYIVNIFTFLVGFVFGVFFYNVSAPMFAVDCFLVLLNIYLYYLLEKERILEFSNLILMELWIFLICAVLFIGWGYGFQDYTFCIICCFFLPFYLPDNQKRKRYHMVGLGLLLILTYLGLFYLCNYTNLVVGIKGTIDSMNIVHAINSTIVALAIMTFSVFSTMIGFDDRRKLSRRADFDQLTGLYNRYALNELIYEKIRNRDKFYLAIADIDFFKKINDKYGHDVGDEALKKVAEVFLKYCENKIYVGRWGGEEFLFISNTNISYEEFLNLLNEIRKYFEKQKFILLGNKVKFTISVGATKYKRNLKEETFVKQADNNLYKAKENGRNQVIG